MACRRPGLRIGGDVGTDGHPIVPADLDGLRVAHRGPSNMIHRDGLLVVGGTVALAEGKQTQPRLAPRSDSEGEFGEGHRGPMA